MTDMIQQAIAGLSGNRSWTSLWNLSLIAPGTGVRRGTERESGRIFFCDQEAARRGQQVRVLRILIEQASSAIGEHHFAQQHTGIFRLVCIRQQPGIIALASSWLWKSVELHPDLISH